VHREQGQKIFQKPLMVGIKVAFVASSYGTKVDKFGSAFQGQRSILAAIWGR